MSEKGTKKGLERKREITAKWFENLSKEHRMYYAAKRRAKDSGRDFNIEVSDIVCPDVCPILGIPLIRGKGRQTANSPSLDRIDTTKGYVKGNIQVVSLLANQMKGPATPEQLLRFADWVKETYDLP